MDYAATYTKMHEANPKMFAGFSIKTYVDDIAALVKETDAKTLLDYGSGKGYQYLAKRVHERWGGVLPTCYDIGVRQLSEKPAGTFAGVVSTDVLEHVPESDVDRVLGEIFAYAERFVFLAIACRASKKRFSDGRDIHVTIKPPAFWDAKISRHARPGLIVKVAYDTAADPQ